MPTKRSIAQIVDEQVKKWNIEKQEKQKAQISPVITISREPGSGGKLVGEKLAEMLSYDLFHQEVLNEMAKSANVSDQMLKTIDEKGLNMIDDWISSLVDSRHLWPDQYMQHLLKIIGAIAKHGAAILIGRGANFVIPREKRFSVRCIASLDFRARNVAKNFNVSIEEAKRRVIHTDADRKAFIRKYFHADIADPLNYDLVINMENVSLDMAASAVKSAMNL